MKNSYPIVLTPDSTGYVVDIPDFQIGTQGDSIPEAMEMARDAIGLMGIDMEDDGKTLPQPSALESVSRGPGDIVTLVDVDFYRVPPAERYADGCAGMCPFPPGSTQAAEKSGFECLGRASIRSQTAAPLRCVAVDARRYRNLVVHRYGIIETQILPETVWMNHPML